MGLSKLLLAVLLCLPLMSDHPPVPDNAVEIVVRPTEIDVKGHVNNAKYVEYLQWSRWEWFDKQGLTNDRLGGLNAVLVVVNININYRQEVKQGEKLQVSVTPKKIGEKSFTLEQIVTKANGEVAADAQVVMVSIDPSVRKSRPLPDEVRKVLEANLP